MPRLRFEIEAEDRGSAEVDKLSRNVDQLDRDIDDLSRGLDRQARAAGESQRATGGLATELGSLRTALTAGVAGAAALAAGFVALTRQQAEYQRLVERSAFVSNRNEREVEALIRTFEQYGIAIDATEDALRTFYDRLGDARADPNIESAQIFRQVGLDIDAADVRLEEFLERIQSFDRQSQIFIIETVLGGEGAAILQAASQAGFQGQVQANLALTLDPDDREAILQADQQIERASQELGLSIDRLIASNAGILTGFLEGTSQFLTGVGEIADGIGRAGQNIASAVGDVSRGQFFAPTRRGTGGTPATSSADFARPRPATGPPPDTGGQQLILEPPEAEAVGRAIADAAAPSFAALAGAIQARNQRGLVDGGLGAVGPGLTLDARRFRVGELPDVETGPLAEGQVLLGSMDGTLQAIHFELAEFLPEIANNTLSAVGAAAEFAASPNILSLVRLGASTVRLLGGIFRQSEPDPFLPEGTDVSTFRAAPFGRVDPDAPEAPGLPDLDLYNLQLLEVLELIDPELVQRFVDLQGRATEAWNEITLSTTDNEERLRLFGDFMTNEFQAAWDQFQLDAVAAWEANADGLGLNEEQFRALDTFVRGPFLTTIDDMETSFIAAWEQIRDAEIPLEEQIIQLGELLGDGVPPQIALLEARLIGAFAGMLEVAREFFEGSQEGFEQVDAAGKVVVDTLTAIAEGLDAIPEEKTITITTIERTVRPFVPPPIPGEPEIFDPANFGGGPARFRPPPIPGEPEIFDPANFGGGRRRDPLLDRGFQFGGRFLVDQPSVFLAGEGGNREVVQITPENAQGVDGAGGGLIVVINYYDRPEDPFAFEDRVVESLRRASERNADVVAAGGVFVEGDR